MLDARYWMLDARYWMLDTGCWILDAGYWMLDARYWMLDTGYWMLGAGCELRDITDRRQAFGARHKGRSSKLKAILTKFRV